MMITIMYDTNKAKTKAEKRLIRKLRRNKDYKEGRIRVYSEVSNTLMVSSFAGIKIPLHI